MSTSFIDRYFTSIALLDDIKKGYIKSMVIIMKSRVPNSVLKNEKIMLKMERGSSEVSFRQYDEIDIVKGYDKKAVLLCSSKPVLEPQDKWW